MTAKKKPAPRKVKPSGKNQGISEPKLTDAERAEIVTRLAMFDRPSAIAADLTERGIDVSQQAVSGYDPKNRGKRAQKWVDLFHTTREQFLKEMASEPIASRAYRLRRLGELHDTARSKGALSLAASFLEQAAKEVGNIYTNVSKVQGVANPTGPTPEDFTPAERANMLADRLGPAFAALGAQKAPTIQ